MEFVQIPKHVFMSKDISHGAALLYGVIYCASLSGPSFRSDDSYSGELDCTIRTISRWIGELRIAGFISIRKTYKNNSPIVDKRYITPLVSMRSTVDKNVPQEVLTIDKNIPNARQECSKTIDKSGVDNIQGETSSPTEVIKEKPKKKKVDINEVKYEHGIPWKRHEIPTLEQCIDYYRASGNGLNAKTRAKAFWDYWEDLEWMRGKDLIISWPKRINTWINNEGRKW
jgi:hypothetical protein